MCWVAGPVGTHGVRLPYDRPSSGALWGPQSSQGNYPTEAGLSTKRYSYLDCICQISRQLTLALHSSVSDMVKGFSLFLGMMYLLTNPYSNSPSEYRCPTSDSLRIFLPLFSFICQGERIVCIHSTARIKVPVHGNASFRPSPPDDENPTKWPIAIFSPELAGQLSNVQTPYMLPTLPDCFCSPSQPRIC